MSHRHTVIEPAEGLTVLVGPNNCGKSAIVTALQILCHNDNSTYVLRHGAKECRIIAETTEGHRIEWIRKRNGSPSYKINGKEFDRLNKKDSGAWDELRKTLRLPRVEFDNSKFDVHIGEQRNPVFLLGDKGKGAAQFFASSSDAIRIVEMQDLYKKQTAENKRERKRLAAQQTQVSQALECLESVPAVDEQLGKFEKQYTVLKADEAKIEQLDKVLAELTKRQTDAKRFAAIDEALQDLPQPPQLSNPIPLQKLVQQIKAQQASIRRSELLRKVFSALVKPPQFNDPARLQQLVQEIKTQQNSIRRAESLHAALKPLAKPPVLGDATALKSKVDSIRKHQNVVTRLAAVQTILSGLQQPPETKDESVSNFAKCVVDLRTELETCRELKQKLQKTQQQLGLVESEIEQWVADNPSCPTCGNEVNAEVMLGGGHQHD